MITREKFNEFLGIKENYEMPERLMKILFNDSERKELFRLLLEDEKDMSRDWFTELFQAEHGDRDVLKQDFTPDCLCELVSKLSGNTPEFADICAGTGGLSIKKWCGSRESTVYCEEVSSRALPLLLTNLCIRNIQAVIVHGNSLTGEIEAVYKLEKGERYSDIFCQLPIQQDSLYQTVIMNPPYSLRWDAVAAFANDIRFKAYGVPPKKAADYAFVMHGLSKLKEHGELFAILPHGVLFRGGSEGQIREKLIRANLIHAVIGLPDNMFAHTGIPVIVLVLKKSRKEKDVLFIDASKEFDKCGKQNIMRQKHIARIMSVYDTRRVEDRFSAWADFQKLEENQFNLNIPRYVDTFEKEVVPDVRETLLEMRAIDKEIADTEKSLYWMMREMYGTNPEQEKEHEEMVELFRTNLIKKHGDSFLTNL